MTLDRQVISDELSAIQRTEAMLNRLMDDHALVIDGLLKLHKASTDGAMNDAAYRAYARYTALTVLRALTSPKKIET